MQLNTHQLNTYQHVRREEELERLGFAVCAHAGGNVWIFTDGQVRLLVEDCGRGACRVRQVMQPHNCVPLCS